ncbi:hypothetical protein ACA910_008581 [Epithemia clementina (nom. ined.)]
MLDLLLSLLFGACGVTFCVQSIYQTYYIPLMDRSTRSNEDLLEEFTYYHRRCTARDITTTNLTELMVAVGGSKDSYNYHGSSSSNTIHEMEVVETAEHLLMNHGAVLIPQLLKPDTIQKLREYAVYRNRVIPEHEEYPVSQGERRISFGYDATEHPALIQAIHEITHNKFLRKLLQQVLGDHDPASTEITTITQYYGAPPQAWHSDTKQDGNALKFARTYSHSYSLFLPLQNTTKKMGATEICPGTHYCANDLSGVCEMAMGGKGLHTAYLPEETFPAGDGALLNQHVWHRGAPHRDPLSPERVVFVMSFIARPKSGDTRQLSRGTYFHQKWNMWGHTWSDLMDPVRYMQKPFSYLKCLCLWSASPNWGYDLVTATYMRFSNGQLGNDLTRLVHIWDDVLSWPEWLRGPNLEFDEDEKQAWQIFIEGTIAAVSRHVQQLALGVHVLYFLALFTLWAITASKSLRRSKAAAEGKAASLLRNSAMRYIASNGIVVLLVVATLSNIQSSEWGQGTITGKALMRPFPPITRPTMEEDTLDIVSQGPTTYPSTLDVLLGTRFDAPWLGAYEHWLDGHPGNRQFRDLVNRLAPSYETTAATTLSAFRHQGKPTSSLDDSIINSVIVGTKGRFLQQDYRTGDWRVQTSQEARRTVQLELACASSPLLSSLRTTLDRSIALYRFGTTLRLTALARKASVFAWLLRERLAEIPSRRRRHKAISVHTARENAPNLRVSSKRWRLSMMKFPRVKTTEGLLNQRYRRLFREIDEVLFRVGKPVWVSYPHHEDHDEDDIEWYRGDIIGTPSEGRATVALETGDIDVFVPMHALVEYKPVQEGDVVFGCFAYQNYLRRRDGDDNNDDEEAPSILDDCYKGQVVRVMPDGAVSIQYEDGDYEPRKPAGHYYLPPFTYELPDGY